MSDEVQVAEAIAYFETALQQAMFSKTDTENIRAALDALRKQSPTSVGKCETPDLGECPYCKKLIRMHEQTHGNIIIPFCKWCGQRLQWCNK